MANVCIVVQCGLPAAGKTTFVNEFCLSVTQNMAPSESVVVRRLQTDMQQRLMSSSHYATGPASRPTPSACERSECDLIPLHICYDKLMPRELEIELLQESVVEYESTSKSKAWKEYRKRIFESVERLLGYLCTRQEEFFTKLVMESETDSLAHLFKASVLNSQQFERHGVKNGNYVVLIDDNMYYQSMRYEYFQLARKYATGFAQIYFPSSVESAISRNSQRGSDRVPTHVIEAMADKLEAPDVTLSWQQFTFAWDWSEDGPSQMSEVIRLVHKALRHPIQPLPFSDEQLKSESRIVCSRNVIHQADSILRKLVGNQLQKLKRAEIEECSKETLREMSATFNGIRMAILDEMRGQTFLLPVELEQHIEGASSNVDSAFYKYICDAFSARLT